MADKNDAILAINGDYYGFREKGYVLRNGVLYDPERTFRDYNSDILVINNDGSFDIRKEYKQTSTSIYEEGAWQVFCFGPGLLLMKKVKWQLIRLVILERLLVILKKVIM